jgi:hypothetical protein
MNDPYRKFLALFRKRAGKSRFRLGRGRLIRECATGLCPINAVCHEKTGKRLPAGKYDEGASRLSLGRDVADDVALAADLTATQLADDYGKGDRRVRLRKRLLRACGLTEAK